MRYSFLFIIFLFFYSCIENIAESQTSITDQKENNDTNDSLLIERALINISKGNLEEAKIDLEKANLLVEGKNGHTHYLLGDDLLELAKQGKVVKSQ